MAENSEDKILRRKELEDLFKDGAIPQEADFRFLINSMINKQDDGFSKNETNGFEVKITGLSSQKFISLFKDVNDPEIFFSLEKDEKDTAIVLSPGAGNNQETPAAENSFFFGKDGKMGIGKKAEENFKLEINGFVGMKGRIGTYKAGQIDADGQWHTILEGLDNCNGFEVLARAGKKGTGKFALLHAIALATFGHSKGRIRKTSSHFGFFWNKLNLRWRGNTHNYSLQLKSNSNYGNNTKISYRITQLWDDETFEEDTY
jgi:hypothetical protein